jgi:hypothetical protein
MVISMLTPKPPVLAAIALLLLFPEAAFAQARSSTGGKSLADCMGFWDAATHMSKVEWRAACKRSMREFPNVKW